MPDILHRITIDAPARHVRELVASAEGIARWWTGCPLEGSTRLNDQFGLYFDDAEKAAAVMSVITDKPDQIAWRVVDGPDSWIDRRWS